MITWLSFGYEFWLVYFLIFGKTRMGIYCHLDHFLDV